MPDPVENQDSGMKFRSETPNENQDSGMKFRSETPDKNQDSDNIRSSRSSRSLVSTEDVMRLIQSYQRMDDRYERRKNSVGYTKKREIPMFPPGKRLSREELKKRGGLKAVLDPRSSAYKFLFGSSNIPPPLPVDKVAYMEEQKTLRALYLQLCPPKMCQECFKEHEQYACCPYVPCSICNQDSHVSHFCPYLDHIPEGTVFDSDKYHVICGSCSMSIDTTTWLCTYCYTPKPKLEEKFCKICSATRDHITVECTKNEDLALLHKSDLDLLIKSRRDMSPPLAEYQDSKRARLACESDA